MFCFNFLVCLLSPFYNHQLKVKLNEYFSCCFFTTPHVLCHTCSLLLRCPPHTMAPPAVTLKYFLLSCVNLPTRFAVNEH